MKSQVESFQKSIFHKYREHYQPILPKILQSPILKEVYSPVKVLPEIKKLFPQLCEKDPQAVTFTPSTDLSGLTTQILRIGCVLSGGQAAGGHNVIVGLFEQLKRMNKDSQLFGFLKGPAGIFKGSWMELREDTI